jgi:hypothetical protein
VRRAVIVTSACLVVVVAGCGTERALSQLQFSELVRDRVVDEVPGILISRFDERGFDYAVGTGERSRLVVGEEYTYYTRHPESLDALVDRLVSLVGTRSRNDQPRGEPGQVQQSIMPVIKPRSFLAEAEARAPGQQLLYGEHTTGLLVFFVLDQPTAVSFLAAGTLQGLGLTTRQLEQLAMDNLARLTVEERFDLEETAYGPVVVSDTADGYDAAMLLSPVLLLTLGRRLDCSSLVVAIPRRDLLIAVPADDPALRGQVSARARAEYHAGPYGISPDLFVVDQAGVRRID